MGTLIEIRDVELLMPDQDGYPTDEELARLKEWPFGDVDGICKFIESIWWMPDGGVRLKRGRLRLATGGWSGNEEIIAILEDMHWFWIVHWELTGRGGLHVFKLTKDKT